METDRSRPVGSATEALARARDHLLSLQDADGWWKGELETNVTIEAEDIMLRRFLASDIPGIETPESIAETARWIRSRQRADGTWASFHGGPPELSTSVEAYVALRFAGDAPDAPHMQKAAAYIREAGGLERSRVFTRLWLALFGLSDWDDLPIMPPEMIFLPPWFPLNIYDWGCWARQTIVPLTIVGAHRPVRPVGFDVDELRTHVAPPPRAPLRTWAGFFQRLDDVLRVHAKLARPGRAPWSRFNPLAALRRLAERRAAEWIVARQEADGCWGGIQPPWVYSLMALRLLGYQTDHPVITAGVRGLDRFTIREETPDGVVRRLEACQSPVWDTALAVIALGDAGVAPDHDAMVRAGRWLLDEEIRVPGDWAVRRPDLPPGGWAFEFDNDGYPDIDDTAEVVMALRRVSLGDDAEARQALEGAVRRGIDWNVGMRSKDGGWGAFDADNTRELCTKLPFCDFGAVIDPPSADVTAHVVEMLAREGRVDDPVTRGGVRWLLANQEDDGSWFGRWGANYVYGTGAAVPALIEAGVPASSQAVRRAVAWLERHQNADGGWGEDMRSYVDDAWRGRGESTASQTAWALLALLAAGERSTAVEAGVGYLVRTQRSDGSWDEPEFTGTGFPGDFYLNYHLYRLVFPIMALGRYGAEVIDEQPSRGGTSA